MESNKFYKNEIAIEAFAAFFFEHQTYLKPWTSEKSDEREILYKTSWKPHVKKIVNTALKQFIQFWKFTQLTASPFDAFDASVATGSTSCITYWKGRRDGGEFRISSLRWFFESYNLQKILALSKTGIRR